MHAPRSVPLFLLALGLAASPLVENAAWAARGGKSGRVGKRSGKGSRSSAVEAAKTNKAGMDPLGDNGPGNAASAPASSAASASSGSPPPQRGPSRIDFDDRLIQGQTNKSGAVYLYDRKELKNRSMVKKRESFRQEIVTSVYDAE